MGEIDRAAYDRYVRQSAIAEKLAEDERFGKQLEAAARAMRDAPDEASRKAPREKLVRLVFGMCERTAGVANGAADGFFQKATGKPAADHAQRVSIGQAEGQVRYAADRMFGDGDAAELAGRMQRWTALQARGFANDAMYESVIAARKAGADLRYAHVPTTQNPCTFCCMIASRGFDFTSRSKKEMHHGCKCRLVPGFRGDKLEGYDPDLYYDRYLDDLKAGSPLSADDPEHGKPVSARPLRPPRERRGGERFESYGDFARFIEGASDIDDLRERSEVVAGEWGRVRLPDEYWRQLKLVVMRKRSAIERAGEGPSHGVAISDGQFGKKFGKHAVDFGLDPAKRESRDAFRGIIDDILENYDEIVTGTWRGQPSACDFYIKGEDVVVVRNDGNVFVTVLKGGVSNARVKAARHQVG